MKKGFTLIEVLIAFAIFTVITGMLLMTVVGMFKSFHQGERMLAISQRERAFLFRLNKEISSVTKIVYPENRFKGDSNSFFLSLPKKII